MRKLGIITLVACVMALCLVLVGCGKKDSKEAFVGTWTLHSIESATEDMSMDADSISLLRDMGVNVTLMLNDDGTFVLNTGNNQMTGSWETKSDTAGTATADGYQGTVDLSIGDDGILTFQQENEKLLFSKEEPATTSTGAAASNNTSSSGNSAASGDSTATEASAATDSSTANGSASTEAAATGDTNAVNTEDPTTSNASGTATGAAA